MKKYAYAKISRRQFLTSGALLGAGTVAAVAIPSTVAAAPEVVDETKSKKEEGYRLTQHVADYYKSAAL